MRRKKLIKNIADLMLTLLVMAGTLSLAWVGLTESKSIPASAAPAEAALFGDEDLVIVIDAGHGGEDCGAIGMETGVKEAELNLAVAELVSDELTRNGAYVIMTRRGEGAIGRTKDEDMRERSRIMNLEGVDLVVSIHMNKFGDRTISGPMVFYMRGSAAGEEFAACVMSGICDSLGREMRHVNPEDLFVLREPKSPSILVECGFLSNQKDEALLMTEEYRQKLAEGISSGILAYASKMKNGPGEASPQP